MELQGWSDVLSKRQGSGVENVSKGGAASPVVAERAGGEIDCGSVQGTAPDR